MSSEITIEQYLNCVEVANNRWPRKWIVPVEIKSMTQGKLISCIESTLLEKLLIALSGIAKLPKDANTILLSDINTTLLEIKKIKNRVTECSSRFKLILKKEEVSICSAIVQAFEPTKISIVYEARRTALINKVQKAESLITWDEYMAKGYEVFFNEVKILLLEGKHLNFYDKQFQESVNRTKQRSSPSKSKASDSPPIQPKQRPSKKKTKKVDDRKPIPNDDSSGTTTKISQPKLSTEVTLPTMIDSELNKDPKPDIPKETTLNPRREAVNSPPTQPKQSPSKKKTKKVDDGKPIPIDDSSGTPTKTPQPKLKVRAEQKSSVTVKVETKEDSKPAIQEGTIHHTMVEAKVSSAKPKEELEPAPPKENLLQRMAREAKGREPTKNKKTNKSAKGKGPISYPIVFTTKYWNIFWSNSKSRTARVWDDYLWNCASIGKPYLMNNIPTGKLIREFDANQDFVVVKKTGTKIQVLMFDGVSQSRAPRQWAEFLAEVYVEKKMNINKLKKHSKEVEIWHQTALSRWDDWVEGVYLPKRTHLPIWRLENEVKTSHTTFIAIEINKESVDIANIGDSAVFCKQNSGEIKHLPTTYDHSLGPKNISTNKLFEQNDIEYLSLKMNDLESLLACTDSIADYILDVKPEALGVKYTESLNELSLDGDKSLYMSSMIDKGPSNGGWLEDDVSFFSLVNNIVKGGEQ